MKQRALSALFARAAKAHTHTNKSFILVGFCVVLSAVNSWQKFALTRHWLAAQFIANGIFGIIENSLFNETLISSRPNAHERRK